MTTNRWMVFFALLLVGTLPAAGQRYPERREVRRGNRAYEKLRFDRSAAHYEKAATLSDSCYEALFNLSDARYKQGRYEEAEKGFRSLAADTLRPAEERAQTHYNLGNALFQQKKYPEALEAFRDALRLHPEDREAKYNYAYTRKLLQQNDERQNSPNDPKQDPEGGQGGGGQPPQNPQSGEQPPQKNPQEGNDGQQPPQGEQPPDQKPQSGDGDPDRDSPQNPDGKGNGQPQPGPAIPPDEAGQILDAVQQQEDQTRDKVNERAASGAQRSGKNW